MKEIRQNIAFSIALHAVIIITVIAANGRGAAYRIPENYIIVSLHGGVIGMTPTESRITNSDKKVISMTVPKNPSLNQVQSQSEAISDGLLSEIQPVNEAHILHNNTKDNENVIPAKAGIQRALNLLDSRLRGNDETFSSRGFSDETPIPHSSYDAIRLAIEKAKTYPFLARKRRLEGTVVTEFTINSNGYPENIAVAKSSGSEILDSAAMNIITRAAPFPQADGHIVIPITFSLTRSTKSPLSGFKE